jgi:hypothetical protein
MFTMEFWNVVVGYRQKRVLPQMWRTSHHVEVFIVWSARVKSLVRLPNPLSVSNNGRLCNYLNLKVSIFHILSITKSSIDVYFQVLHLIQFPYTVPQQTNAVDCGVFVCRYVTALYQNYFTPIIFVDLHLEKPPLKTTISESFLLSLMKYLWLFWELNLEIC